MNVPIKRPIYYILINPNFGIVNAALNKLVTSRMVHASTEKREENVFVAYHLYVVFNHGFLLSVFLFHASKYLHRFWCVLIFIIIYVYVVY